MITKHTHHQGNNPFGDDGIAIGSKNNIVAVKFGIQPNFALATFYDVVFSFGVFFNYRQAFAKFNEVIILLHPIGEHVELFDDFLLYVWDAQGLKFNVQGLGGEVI